MDDASYLSAETVLKTRLAIDDRPIKNLEKKINHWLATLATEPIDVAQYSYETLLVQIASYQTNIDRLAPIQQVNNEDVQRYASMVDHTVRQVHDFGIQRPNFRIVKAVERTRVEIKGLKEELSKAQKIRDNKLEYDKVAREIMKLQTRDEYHKSIAQLQKDIDMLKQEKIKREGAFESRKRNLAALIDTTKQLQRTVEEERAMSHESQKMLMDMDRGYESSDDEEEQSVSPTTADDSKQSHRFKERNDEDDEGDDGDEEEGMVMDTDEGAVIIDKDNA
ncbi:uncharacterized protein BYT42DRAFT_633482 [Radiomyces spectabilis]|uniref:uncharacterized protein n=1 Tax=Radiomyces spectabilis TaxID=64574 RepID=UPI00221F89EF|nr:uncharacterized protein BYT42DRAFT_633482 [Radiomyces spectabilis]KAI8384832.1 hypothetical protein BYT42DRAFT_633482 [Radiomyces spectabilis]